MNADVGNVTDLDDLIALAETHRVLLPGDAAMLKLTGDQRSEFVQMSVARSSDATTFVFYVVNAANSDGANSSLVATATVLPSGETVRTFSF